jgi:hypothetical protein
MSIPPARKRYSAASTRVKWLRGPRTSTRYPEPTPGARRRIPRARPTPGAPRPDSGTGSRGSRTRSTAGPGTARVRGRHGRRAPRAARRSRTPHSSERTTTSSATSVRSRTVAVTSDSPPTAAFCPASLHDPAPFPTRFTDAHYLICTLLCEQLIRLLSRAGSHVNRSRDCADLREAPDAHLRREEPARSGSGEQLAQPMAPGPSAPPRPPRRAVRSRGSRSVARATRPGHPPARSGRRMRPPAGQFSAAVDS